jgi:integrase
MARKWGLPPVEWILPELSKDGSHYHLPRILRVEIYHSIKDMVERAWWGAEACVRPYRLHDLRHTFNTNMSKAGVKDAVVMKLTGHKTLEMFLRYSHLDRECPSGKPA